MAVLKTCLLSSYSSYLCQAHTSDLSKEADLVQDSPNPVSIPIKCCPILEHSEKVRKQTEVITVKK